METPYFVDQYTAHFELLCALLLVGLEMQWNILHLGYNCV